MLKWQLYNKEEYSEIYFRGDSPRSFAEWATVVPVNSARVYWLSPNAFLTKGYHIDWLSDVTRAKKNFPRFYFRIQTTLPYQDLCIWATTDMEAYRTLYEMTMYNDFASSLKGISDNTGIKLPTMLLREVLNKATNPLELKNIRFQSTFASRVLAQSGESTSITFAYCAFELAAEEGFVDGMLSKTDKNSGLTKICFILTLPFHSEQNLVRLMMSEYGPIDFSYLYPNSPYPEAVLDSLCNSPRLQSLEVCENNFTSLVAYAGFVNSLHSTSLRSLTITDYDIRDLAFPVEIFEKLALTHFSMDRVSFCESGWRSLLQAIPKCKTLISLEFKDILWWDSEDDEVAQVAFAMELAQFLKDNTNILTTNKKSYFGDHSYNGNGGILYTTYLAPILEHNRLIKNLKTLEERENYEVRGFLAAEVVGTRFASNSPAATQF